MPEGQRSLVTTNALFGSHSALAVELRAEWFLSVSYWDGDLQNQSATLFPKEITRYGG